MKRRTEGRRRRTDLSRRSFLSTSGAGALGGSLIFGPTLQAGPANQRIPSLDAPGIPGPYPGRVVEVTDPHSVAAEAVDGASVTRMMR